MDKDKMMVELENAFGSRAGFLGVQILLLAMSGQPCDVTYFKKKPVLDVKINQKVVLALIYGAGAEKLKEMLDNIKLSNGDVVSIGEIWTVNPMPEGGFSAKDLAAVDLSEGEEQVGPNGETLRKMISDTYHCSSKKEEDFYLKRFIAS